LNQTTYVTKQLIKRLYKEHEIECTYNTTQKNHTPIKEKLTNSGTPISKADKGNSIINIYQHEYNKKS